MQTRRTGRRPGTSGTRDEIAAAAARLFAERGYDRTSLRAVAAEAGVDPALVTHYFGSKQQLFASVVRLPFDPGQLVAQVLEGDPEHTGERLARAIIGALEQPSGRERAIGVVRAAATEPEAASLLRDQVTRDFYGPIAHALGAGDADLRANLVGSQMVGLVMARYVVGIEPLASAEPDTVVRSLAPVLQHYLTGNLDAAVG